MTSDDRASVCEPRNRNGRMLVGCRPHDVDDESADAAPRDDNGVFTGT